MSALVTYTERDYVAAYELAGRPTCQWWIWHGIAGSVLLLAGIASTSDLLRLGFLGALIGGGVGHLAVQKLWRPRQARRAFETTKAPPGPVEIALEQNGIRLKGPDGGGLIRWSHIHRWRADATCVLVYENQAVFRIFPRRISSSDFEFATLEERLRENVGAAT